jgi:chloramphenicol-sensitive protein RarD
MGAWFLASAAQRIPLTSLGLLQYITPTMQLMLGVLVYQESFNYNSLIGFGMVWVALLIFWADGFAVRLTRSKD